MAKKTKKIKWNDPCWKAVHGKETLSYKENLVIFISLLWTYLSAVIAVYASCVWIMERIIDWIYFGRKKSKSKYKDKYKE